MEGFKYYVVLYLHWYHKEHNGKVEAVYSTKAAAINHINFRKKQSKFSHANHDKTFLAVYQSKPAKYDKLEYDIYMLQPVTLKKQTGKVTLKLNVTFPEEVTCLEGEMEKPDYIEKLHDQVRENVKIVALDKHSEKTKLNFSTEGVGHKTVEFVCDCMVKE